MKKKKDKDKLTHKQFQILWCEHSSTQQVDQWLKSTGLNPNTFASTDSRLLEAQQKAHLLLTQHRNLLTDTQRKTLTQFRSKMRNGRIRERLKPSAAYPIFNIHSKIIRQLFRQHRQLTQA